jgi:hypothetical protein
MALPKLSTPLFEVKLPSTGKKIHYRPFTVKEEKVLLIARESEDIDQAILAMKQIINNCVPDLDVEKLPTFDLEFLLLNIRARSVNNVISFKIKDPETSEEVDLDVDINDINVYFDKAHSKKIQLEDGMVLLMKYPNINMLKEIVEAAGGKSSEKMFKLMASCFDTLSTQEEVYKMSEYSEQEIEEFVDSMSSKNLSDIKQFFDTMPVLKYEKKYRTSDGKEKTFVMQGTETFFI